MQLISAGLQNYGVLTSNHFKNHNPDEKRVRRKKSLKIIRKGRPPTAGKRRIRPPSARVRSGSRIISELDGSQRLKQSIFHNNSVDESSMQESTRMARSIINNQNNNDSNPIRITTINNSSQSLVTRSVANFTDDPASEYNEK